jgi:2-phosphoglycolate phosphatase
MTPELDPRMVLIDLDGTLVDSVPDLAFSVDLMMAELGRPTRGEAEVRNWVGNGVERLVKRALTGTLDGEPDADEFERAFPIFAETYAAHNGERSRLYPGVREGVEMLSQRGLRLGCVTNKAARFTEPLLDALGIADRFGIVVCGDQLPEKKPHPMPLLHAFAALVRKGHNRIPFVCEVLADLDTPLSCYLKLAAAPTPTCSSPFRAARSGAAIPSSACPAAPCSRSTATASVVERDGAVIEQAEAADPLAWIEAFQQRFSVAEHPDMPRFAGGLVGYFGYDTVRYIEPKADALPEPGPDGYTPDILLMVSEEVVVFDNLRGRIYIIVHLDPEPATPPPPARPASTPWSARCSGARRVIRTPAVATVRETDFVSGFTEDGFKAGRRPHQGLHPRRRLHAGGALAAPVDPVPGAPAGSVPGAARAESVAVHVFPRSGDFQIVGSSPEILTRLEDGVVTVRPIAGTRRRGYTDEEDLALERSCSPTRRNSPST